MWLLVILLQLYTELFVIESFPATALTQDFPDSSESDDDHVTIARAVQNKKRKAAVLSDDSEWCNSWHFVLF